MAPSKCMILMAFLVAFSVFSSNFCVSGMNLVRVEVHPPGSPQGVTVPYYIDLDHECPEFRAGKKTSINLGGVDFNLKEFCPPAQAPTQAQYFVEDEVEGPGSGPAQAPYADGVADAEPET